MPTIPFTPDLVIYHDRCSDGFGAAWVLRRHFGPGLSFLPATHGHPPTVEQVRGKKVVMVDVGFPREIYLALKQSAEQLILLDHHQSTRHEIGDVEGVFFDDARSGIGLAWDAVFPGQARPRLVDLIEDRDLCRHNIPQSKWLCLLDGLPMQFDAWDEFSRRLEFEPDRVGADATLVTSHEAMAMARVMTHAIPIRQDGLIGWKVNAPHDMAYRICVALAGLPKASFGMSWYMSSSGLAVCSWRPRPGSGLDVSRLAEQFGGGGNPYAAGARLTLDQVHGLSASVDALERTRLIQEAGMTHAQPGQCGCGPTAALRDAIVRTA